VEYGLTVRGREVAEIARRLRDIERALQQARKALGRPPR